jgi:hypothetical protein
LIKKTLWLEYADITGDSLNADSLLIVVYRRMLIERRLTSGVHADITLLQIQYQSQNVPVSF